MACLVLPFVRARAAGTGEGLNCTAYQTRSPDARPVELAAAPGARLEVFSLTRGGWDSGLGLKLVNPKTLTPGARCAAQVRQLQPGAVASWWQPGHPGWAIYPVDSEQFISTGALESVSVLSEQIVAPPPTLAGARTVPRVVLGVQDFQSRWTGARAWRPCSPVRASDAPPPDQAGRPPVLGDALCCSCGAPASGPAKGVAGG